MHTAIVSIEGITPLQLSREYASSNPKENNETHDAYERRTWPLRAHTKEDGTVFIPSLMFKKAMVSSAKYLGHRIQGAGQKTWSKKFESGVTCNEDLLIDASVQHKDGKWDLRNCEGRWVHGSSNGKAGSGTRVWKCFPTFLRWGGDVSVIILDEIIPLSEFADTWDAMGKYNGLGTWRPANGGEYGRFRVKQIKWQGKSYSLAQALGHGKEKEAAA